MASRFAQRLSSSRGSSGFCCKMLQIYGLSFALKLACLRAACRISSGTHGCPNIAVARPSARLWICKTTSIAYVSKSTKSHMLNIAELLNSKLELPSSLSRFRNKETSWRHVHWIGNLKDSRLSAGDFSHGSKIDPCRSESFCSTLNNLRKLSQKL